MKISIITTIHDFTEDNLTLDRTGVLLHFNNSYKYFTTLPSNEKYTLLTLL